MQTQSDSAKRIMVVDDVKGNRLLLEKLLLKNTSYQVTTVGSGKELFEVIDSFPPDLILMDIMMPEMDGYEATEKLKATDQYNAVPIIFLTAKTDVKSIVHAFDQGGVDYLTKPFNKDELLVRINTHLSLHDLEGELQSKNHTLAKQEMELEHQLNDKTEKIDRLASVLVSVLENANQANDDDTGNHIKRVSLYSEQLARQLGCSPDFIRQIKLYASLHDVGKVGISDLVLKKPGKYTDEEFDKMKQHVAIGARMLSNPDIDIMAKNIAEFHHEKWNGKGYLNGLSGDDIPLEAQIVALADVYDALLSKRVYKEPFPIERVESIFKEESGQHFSPKVVEAYFEIRDQMMIIKQSLQ